MKSSVITFPGSNCDRDMDVALKKFGFKNKMVWHDDAELPKSDLVVLPGGFSYGDYLRCGSMASKSKIMQSVINFANSGGMVMGICNGFQILVETGLVPGVLLRNKYLEFICKNGWGWNDADYWGEVEIDVDGSEIVYVEVNRNKPVFNSLQWTNSNNQIGSTLSTAEDNIGKINLIGLKSAFLKTSVFRKGNFIHLDDYLRREYAKVAPKTFFKYEGDDLDKLKTINKYIDNDEVREIVELSDSCKNNGIAEICKRLGVAVEMTEDTMLQEIMDEWNNRHKMLTFVSDWEIEFDSIGFVSTNASFSQVDSVTCARPHASSHASSTHRQDASETHSVSTAYELRQFGTHSSATPAPFPTRHLHSASPVHAAAQS